MTHNVGRIGEEAGIEDRQPIHFQQLIKELKYNIYSSAAFLPIRCYGQGGKIKQVMEFKTTFKFYAVENAPYIGAYRCGSLNNGEPQIMFAMDFHTWTLKDTPKEELLADFKDGMLQTITHEFCHAIQEMLDKDYDELEVEKILGANKPTWNVFEAPAEEEMPETVFKISDFLQWINNSNAKSAEDFKEQANDLFMAHRLWIEAEKKNSENVASVRQ